MLPVHASSVVRILLANEPRSYREVIAAACAALRPRAIIAIADTGEYEAAIARDRPHFVICSNLTAALQYVPAWVLLYPDGAGQAEFSIAGERTTSSTFDFIDLLALIDRTECLAALEVNELPEMC